MRKIDTTTRENEMNLVDIDMRVVEEAAQGIEWPTPCSEELAEACEADDRDYEEDYYAATHYGIVGWGNS